MIMEIFALEIVLKISSKQTYFSVFLGNERSRLDSREFWLRCFLSKFILRARSAKLSEDRMINSSGILREVGRVVEEEEGEGVDKDDEDELVALRLVEEVEFTFCKRVKNR